MFSNAYADNIKSLIKKHGFKQQNIGIEVLNLSDKKIIYSHQSTQEFAPGSVQKILTAIYALNQLGFDYRPKTTLHFTGSISGKTLDGNLILQGGGDPYLQYQHLFKFAVFLKSKGISEVSGDFLYDDSLMGKNFIIEENGLIDEGYNSGVSALSVNFNQTRLWKEKDGFSTIPQLNYISVNSNKKDYPIGQRFEGTIDKDQWYFSTFKKYAGQERIPIRDSSLFTANILKYFLELLSIKVKDPKPNSQSYDPRPLISHNGMELDELIALNFEYSNNLMAELIMMLAANKANGKKLNIEKSAVEMNKWFQAKYQFKPKKFIQINGSGLGDGNLITAHDLNTILVDYYHQIWHLLPINGVKGYLKKRLNSSSKAFKIWAKTGTLDYVSGISGLMITNSNKTLLFSIFNNDNDLREKIFGPKKEISYKFRAQADKWNARSNQLENSILDYIMEKY